MTPSVHALRETQPNVTLVERLVAAGLISELQLRRALQEKARHERPLGKILVELGMISENVLSETLHQLLDDTRLDLGAFLPDPNAIAVISKDTAERACVMPIEFDSDARLLTLAAPTSLTLAADDELFRSLGSDMDVVTVVAAESEIKAAIRKFYGVNLAIPGILREIDGVPSGQLDTATGASGYVSPLIRLVDAIIFEASRRRASAIHFEPEIGFLRVRLRIDGVLTQFMALHQSYWECMQERLTGMGAGGDGPSNAGHLSIGIGQRRVTLHFSRRVTLKGNDVVVRIVEHNDPKPLHELGLDNEELARLRLMLARPGGLIVVAGPSGSGKTSTLHAILSYRSDESVAIVTHEDPMATSIPGLRQTHYSRSDHPRDDQPRDDQPRDDQPRDDQPSDGNSLESLLQQDADVLMVDELKDRQSAAIALCAASSGHQVFAALTAGSAMTALAKLQDFGLHRRQLAGNVSGIIFQRLLRRLCAACKQPNTPQPFEQDILEVSDRTTLQLYREVGCEQCSYLGFRGRLAVFEVLRMDDRLNELLEGGSTSIEMQRAVEAAGFKTLIEQTIRQVLAGETSLAEASRVVDFSARLK